MAVYQFPTGYDTAECFLVPINAALIPLVAGMLRDLEQPRCWATENDYERGYNAIVELEAYMTALCVRELVESQDRLYRLLDTALNGTTYSVVSADPLEISPAIPTVPPLWDDALEPSALFYSRETFRSLDNGLHGRAHTGYPDPRSIRQQLEDLLEGSNDQEELDVEQLEELVKIAAVLL